MTINELLCSLRSKGIQLRVEGEKLHYNAPVGAVTPDLAAELGKRKAEILKLLRLSRLASLSISRASRDQDLPLSFAQQRLWFLDQLEPGSPVYNLAKAVRLKGRLSVEALQKGLDAIVARHEVLRTRITAVAGTPVQVVSETASAKLAVIHVSCESEMHRIITSEVQRPFNLSSDLMLRATLVRLGDNANDHVLLLVMHHIASDGWSMSLLLQELAAFYRAFAMDNPSPLPDLTIQYADYAAWQRRWLQGKVLEEQLSYWKQQLSDVPALELPTDRPRPAVQTFRGAQQSWVLPTTLADELKALSLRESVTLFVTVLAAFQTLLYRYAGQTDIAVGSPIANRTRLEIEKLIGFFVNTLVLRTDLSGNPTFKELLARVRKTAMNAYEHQDLPFEKIVEELNPDRSLSHTPLFQVMFVLQNVPRSEFKLPGLTLSPVRVTSETTKFDLTLSIVDRTDSLAASVGYNTDLFDGEMITRMLRHFETLLRGIAANPEQRISDLSMLTASERQQLLVDWNHTKGDYPEDQCVHELFEAQADRTPDRVAVVFEGRQLTYRELNQLANQFAHYLRELGVGPEVLIGISIERSLEMVVALLGILKAGGVYVPLDPSYPNERLAFMVQDAGISILLTQQRVVEALPKNQSARMICIDSDWEVIAQGRQDSPVRAARPENLAYVIYTSGSTGKPKGVQVPHRAVVNFLNSMRERPGLTPSDILVSVTTLSFDIAALEIFLPLCVGARIALVSSEVAADGARLASILETSGATMMQATPATWQLLMQAGWCIPKHFKVLCGGEELPRELAHYLLSGASSVWNMYGPTETTIWSAIERMESVEGTVPIGRPIANTQIYILDNYFNPVPVGVHGELYIGGIGVARGYRNRPELVAEKFVPDPFSSSRGARLYRTGDRARYLSDGKIEFLGRVDHQAKLRGFRIELGEIEATLSRHPSVSQAVVAVKEISGDRRLVAYVVAKGETVPASTELRDFLRAELPPYMLPSSFVFLDGLPHTPNGKVDRRALPTPDASRPDLAGGFVPPRNPVEEVLAGIWAEVLKLEQVGVHDNFFELGGHSLLAIQVMSRVRTAFQVEIALKALFENPTVAGLAAQIVQQQAGSDGAEDTSEVLADVESLSDEEAERLLAQESSQRT